MFTPTLPPVRTLNLVLTSKRLTGLVVPTPTLPVLPCVEIYSALEILAGPANEAEPSTSRSPLTRTSSVVDM